MNNIVITLNTVTHISSLYNYSTKSFKLYILKHLRHLIIYSMICNGS